MKKLIFISIFFGLLAKSLDYHISIEGLMSAVVVGVGGIIYISQLLKNQGV